MDKKSIKLVITLFVVIFSIAINGCTPNTSKIEETSNVNESQKHYIDVGIDFENSNIDALEYTLKCKDDFSMSIKDMYLDGNRIYGTIFISQNTDEIIKSANLDMRIICKETKCDTYLYISNPIIDNNYVKWNFNACLRNNEMEYDNLEFIFNTLKVNNEEVLDLKDGIYDISISNCNISTKREYEMGDICGKITPMGMQACAAKQDNLNAVLYYDGQPADINIQTYRCEYNNDYSYYYMDWGKYLDISHINKIIVGEHVIYDSKYAQDKKIDYREKCVIGISPYDFPDAFITDCINDFLRIKNCNYYVTFKIITPGGFNGYFNYSSEEIVKCVEEYIQAGNQLDMYFADYGNDGLDNSCYEIMAHKAMLYPLDTILTNINIPNIIIENAKIENKIYGLDTSMENVSSMPAYIINNKLVEKYGYNISDFNCTISELKDIFYDVKNAERDNSKFNCVNFYNSNNQIFCNQYVSSKIDSVVIDSHRNAESILECNEYISFLKELYECESSYNTFGKVADTLITVVDSINPITDFLKLKIFSDEDNYTIKDFTILYPYGEKYIFNPYYLCMCIMNGNRNHDNAIDFLTKIYCDNELYSIVSQCRFSNKFLCTDSTSDKYIASIIENGTTGFNKDNSFMSTLEISAIDKTNAVINKLWKVFYQTDFDDYVEALRNELKSAGIDDLVDAINRGMQ